MQGSHLFEKCCCVRISSTASEESTVLNFIGGNRVRMHRALKTTGAKSMRTPTAYVVVVILNDFCRFRTQRLGLGSLVLILLWLLPKRKYPISITSKSISSSAKFFGVELISCRTCRNCNIRGYAKPDLHPLYRAKKFASLERVSKSFSRR